MKKLMALRLTYFVFPVIFILTFVFTVNAQTCFDLAGSNPSSNTQNFDGLGTSPGPAGNSNLVFLNANNPRQVYSILDNATTNNGTAINVPGWSLYEEGASTGAVSGRYNVGSGTSRTGNGYSFGTNADRAFGTLNDNNLPITYVGACYRNSGSQTVSVQINFTGEMWRFGNSGNTDTLNFQFAINATNILQGAYTDFNALDFATPNSTGNAGSRDGNLPANQTVVPPTTLPVSLSSGQNLYIRWCDTNIGGNDDGLAIDDFTINLLAPTAAGVGVSGQVVSASNRPISLAFITITSPNGISRTTLTNPFGYYTFDDLEVGETYIFHIRSKKHTFSNSLQAITILNSITSLDFVSDN